MMKMRIRKRRRRDSTIFQTRCINFTNGLILLCILAESETSFTVHNKYQLRSFIHLVPKALCVRINVWSGALHKHSFSTWLIQATHKQVKSKCSVSSLRFLTNSAEMTKRLEEEIKDRLGTKKLERHEGSSSGCINKGICYSIDDEEKIFVKSNATPGARVMFEGELKSLKDISATKTIRVPRPNFALHDYDKSHASSIVMEYIDISPLDESSARDLGESLASLHTYNKRVIKYNKSACKWIGGKPPSAKAVLEAKERNRDEEDDGTESEEENQFSKHGMRFSSKQSDTNTPKSSGPYPDRFVPEPGTEEIRKFGYDLPTSCGLIPQQNEWTDDWVSFYARHRLDKSIRSLLSDHGDRELMQLWSHLQLKVDKFFQDIPTTTIDGEDIGIVPALLHGDLWSGNAAQSDQQGVVYDPSSFYGHSEYEFGIVQMFGGFPESFEEAYFELVPKQKNFDMRNKLYKLFHHLNHWDHFGQGYRPSSLKLMKDLL